MTMRTSHQKARIVILGYLDPDYENRPSCISNHDEKHQTITFAIRCMDGILGSKGRREWSIPARPQSSTRSLGTGSTRTGSSAGRSSW